MHLLLRKDAPFKITQHKDTIFEIKRRFVEGIWTVSEVVPPENHLIIICDANAHPAGYVPLIIDYTDEEIGGTSKIAPLAFGSKQLTTVQMSLTMFAKEFLAMHLIFDGFGHMLWGTKKPIIVLTDKKELFRFSQAEQIPPSPWIFFHQTLQFNFVIAHVPGVENPAVEYLSRLEVRPEYRIHLKLSDILPVFHVEIDIASKTPKQKEEETDFYPYDEIAENFRKPRSNTPDDEPLGHREQEHPAWKESDVHQMTAHGATGHLKTSVEDQINLVRVVNTILLPPHTTISVSPSNAMNLQAVHENKGDV